MSMQICIAPYIVVYLFSINNEFNTIKKMETSNSKQIATTILEQLGGNKFIAMTGASYLAATGRGLQMKLRTNQAKATHLVITLQPSDTYKMEFIKCSRVYGKISIVKEYEGVYCDMLRDLFTSVTGYDTHL